MLLSKSTTIGLLYYAVLQAVVLMANNLQTVETFLVGSQNQNQHHGRFLRRQQRHLNTNDNNIKNNAPTHNIRPHHQQQPLFAAARRATGGRRPGSEDKISSSDEWEPTPCQPDEARLTVIQITDVYTLEHLAHVKTLVEETRAKSTGSKVICMITGDFLSPYLLSSVDRGQGMMDALNRIPMVRA